MSGPVQVTLTFTSIALAIAALSKIGADALVAGGDVTVVTHAGNDPKPDPKPAKGTKSSQTGSNSAAPAAAASPAPSPAPASTPAAASPSPAPATSASGGTDFYTANFIPQKLVTLCSPAVGDRPKVVALLEKFGVKKGGDVSAEQMPSFLLSVNELLLSSANSTTAITALKEGVGGVKVPDAFIPSREEEAEGDLT